MIDVEKAVSLAPFVELLSDPGLRKRLKARRSLLEFTTYTNPSYQVNWHHKLLADKLTMWADPKSGLDRLMIFMPPQHGKSELSSRRLIAWLFGRHPDAWIIHGSYASDLVERMSADVQRIMESSEYAELFPEVRLPVRGNRDGLARTDSEFSVLVNGKPVSGYRCAGILGGVTGMPATHLILDDPIKNQQEADSALFRDRVYGEYLSSFKTRLRGRGKILIINTRWHEDDLCGRLLDQARTNPEADQWEVISLPAIAGDGVPLNQTPEDNRLDGEALWPARYPVEVLRAIKAGMKGEGGLPPRVWYALYQQTPQPKGGQRFLDEYFQHKYHADQIIGQLRKFQRIIAVCDAAFKGKEVAKGKTSAVVIQVWGRWEGKYYLLDHWRAQVGFVATKQAVKDMYQRWKRHLRKFWIEDKANGSAVFDELHQEVVCLETLPSSNDSKESRACVSEELHARGLVYYPDDDPEWFDHYKGEHTGFPNAAFDDEVDCAAYALIDLEEKKRARWW